MNELFVRSITRIFIILFILTVGFSIFRIPVSGETASDSGGSIRNKVREKIEQIKSKPKAVMGTVTDKTEDTIELKEKSGEIQLISVNPNEVTFVKIGTSTSNIKFSDVAIGDFTIAMGFFNGNTVLSARRVLLTKPIEAPMRNIVSGKIFKINKRVVSVRQTDGKEFELIFGKRWKGPEIKELAENDSITAIGEVESNKVTVRSLFFNSNESQPTSVPKQ